jgi:hypothetical protein
MEYEKEADYLIVIPYGKTVKVVHQGHQLFASRHDRILCQEDLVGSDWYERELQTRSMNEVQVFK